MTGNWQAHAESALGQNIVQLERLGGGDFADAYKARLSNKRLVFIKTHSNPPPNFFATEATGLGWLSDTNTLNIPTVLAVNDEPAYLALEWIESGQPNNETDIALGRQLASMHEASNDTFGRPDQQTTGSLALPNQPRTTWEEFYATQRLLPLARIAFDHQALSTDTIKKMESIAGRLNEFCSGDESPSLLHGDLWAGNRMVDTQGASWLLDPAAHYGHREFDLSMMQLFGGYSASCFEAYAEMGNLSDEWQSRISLHQLAPLTVHAIKFGGSYRDATRHAVAQYC